MQRYDWDGHGMDEVDIGGDYVRYEDAAALEAENAALREKLATAEVKPNLVGYDIEKDKEFKNGFNRLVESGIDKKTRRAIVKEVMEAIHAHAEAFYQRGLAAAEARTVLTADFIKQVIADNVECSENSDNLGYAIVRERNVDAIASAILTASAAPAAQEDALPAGWQAEHAGYDAMLTEDANYRKAVLVRRLAPPFGDAQGNRVWFGPTLAEAIENGKRAIAANTPKEI